MAATPVFGAGKGRWLILRRSRKEGRKKERGKKGLLKVFTELFCIVLNERVRVCKSPFLFYRAHRKDLHSFIGGVHDEKKGIFRPRSVECIMSFIESEFSQLHGNVFCLIQI